MKVRRYSILALPLVMIGGLMMAACVGDADPAIDSNVDVIPPPTQSSTSSRKSRIFEEVLLSETENAYNPIPNADGTLIAYVRTGWGRDEGSGGLGRSNLISEISIMNADGEVLSTKPLADSFLSGWTGNGELICFRDGKASLVRPDGDIALQASYPGGPNSRSERVAFLNSSRLVLWWQNNMTNVRTTPTGPGAYSETSDYVNSTILSSQGDFASIDSPIPSEALVVPSPDQKYLALITPSSLKIYDTAASKWTDLGQIKVHPSDSWDYIKPSWGPWFADSKHLVYSTSKGIVVNTPDGSSKHLVAKPRTEAGIPVPSRDGATIAYVTFDPRPKRVRPDLKFWGGTTIWTVPASGDSPPRAVTKENADTTIDLKWLNDHELVFDRIGDEEFYAKARLWKVGVLP